MIVYEYLDGYASNIIRVYVDFTRFCFRYYGPYYIVLFEGHTALFLL